MKPLELWDRINEYARRRALTVGEKLGDGRDGIVFKAENQAESIFCAIKCHYRFETYRRERDVYLRLQDEEVFDICDMAVPQLIRFDDELSIIEMTFVIPPFIVDFASAFLDREPGFSEETMADWRAQKAEEFGPRWSDVQRILTIFEALGIYLTDVHLKNVIWPD